MKEARDIDNIFRDGLEHVDIPFNDLDWDDLEDRLHPGKKRKSPVVWFSLASGIAAMILLTLLLVRPGGKLDNTEKTQSGTVRQKQGLSDESPVEHSLKKDILASTDQGQKHDVSGKELPAEDKRPTLAILADHNAPLVRVLQVTSVKNQELLIPKELILPIAQYKPEKAASEFGIKKPKLILSILAAPDLTTVQKSGKSSLSGGVGIEATFFLSKRLSLTTGASYAKKIYDADFTLYKPSSNYAFKYTPSNIHANCDVVDIPLNVNYRIIESNKDAISISTGLSSYLMIKENYQYSYLSAGASGPKSYEIKNQNQHYFGVVNIGIEFQHKIDNNLSISARPFMKIPLTDIGYGNSKLSSTGLAISINMNLFKKN